MSRYAEGTSVAADQSQAEIQRILKRYGAEGFMFGWDEGKAVVGFRAHGRNIRFLVPMPERGDFRLTPTGRTRSAGAIDEAVKQEERRLWRALAMVVKAKLEIVESGIATFEEEFLAHILLPTGNTVGQQVGWELERADAGGLMPGKLLEIGS